MKKQTKGTLKKKQFKNKFKKCKQVLNINRVFKTKAKKFKEKKQKQTYKNKGWEIVWGFFFCVWGFFFGFWVGHVLYAISSISELETVTT